MGKVYKDIYTTYIMISIIITSYYEPKTIGKAIEGFLNQKIKEPYELYVCAPDNETLNIAKGYGVKTLKDPGTGKTNAINLLLPKLKGDIIILSDGDVYTFGNSVNMILKQFEDEKVGCVGGRPIPMEDKLTKWGFFANFLFEAAHQLRLKRGNNKDFLEVSGYLWAFRKKLINRIPLDTAEDSIVPLMVYQKGLRIGYAKNAKVYVKNVDNWKDWLNQKIRTSKGHETLGKYFPNRPIMKSFFQEVKGIIKLFSYPNNFKEFFWLIQLIIMRGYMWFKAKRGKKHKDGWKPIPSTK